MINIRSLLKVLVGGAFLLLLLNTSMPAYAQEPWPPFWFSMTPSYDNGKITYNLELSARVDWRMTDLTFKIPLPPGTRFVEGHTLPSTKIDFDGQEITIFTAFYTGWLADTSFVLEVTDPSQTVFTTHTWISWVGDQPGDYLDDDVTIDISRPPLEWRNSSPSRLLLNTSAVVTDDIITYTIQPTASVRRSVMWDVRVNVPLPAGTTLLSAEVPPPAVVNFDGHEASFFTLQLAQGAETGPLIFKVSAENTTNPLVVTRAWASWKNTGWGVGREFPADEETATGDLSLVVQPAVQQQVFFDNVKDVPFSNYDLTSVAFQEDGSALVVIFYVDADPTLDPTQPLAYNFFVDLDCDPNTGNWVGAEYWLSYESAKDSTFWVVWDDASEDFLWDQGNYEIDKMVGHRGVAARLPEPFLKDNPRFCWRAEMWNYAKTFRTRLPDDSLPNGNLTSLHYEATGAKNNISATTIAEAINGDLPTQAAMPGSTSVSN